MARLPKWVLCQSNSDWEVCREGLVRRSNDAGMVSVRVVNGSNGRQYRAVQYRHPETDNKTSVPVSHLVLQAFDCPRPTTNHVALHKNGDLTDDHLENLIWVTRSESARLSTEARYGFERSAKVRSRGGNSKISDAIARRVCVALVAKDASHDEIAHANGVSKQFVTQIATGHRRTNIAMEYGLLDDNPAAVRYAWPYISSEDRSKILSIAKQAVKSRCPMQE